MKVNKANNSPWLNGIETMHVPVAHGEGRFMMEETVLNTIQNSNQIAMQYTTPEGKAANNTFPYNPNGSDADIAGMTDESGRVFALMPHPERGMFTWQRDDYMELKDRAQRDGSTLPETSDGMALFGNAAAYFEISKMKHA